MKTDDGNKYIIDVQNLRFGYHENPDVIKGINFRCTEGEKVGVIGPNGAGKTTLFNLFCGLLKPSDGSISLNGNRVIHREFNTGTGYVFQDPDDQIFCISVKEEINFGLFNMGLNKDEVKKRSADALRITGCEHLQDRVPHNLSGGEKRMVSIASVIAMNPSLMIYDEPCSGLDARSRRRLISFLNEREDTMLLSSHDLEFILETCRRVILIDDGMIIAEGFPDIILGNKNLMIKHGLESPYSLL